MEVPRASISNSSKRDGFPNSDTPPLSAAGKHRCAPGLAPGVLRRPRGPHHRAVGIGVAEHGGISSGGVYSMISSVLGGQMGGTVGLLYVFGQVRHLTCSFASVSLHFLICLGEEWGKTAHG